MGMAGNLHGIEYKFQIICAQPGERFTDKPEDDEFQNCDRMCGEDLVTATTTVLKVAGCEQWCAGDSQAWSTKRKWKNCKRCDKCSAIGEATGCKSWCAGNSN